MKTNYTATFSNGRKITRSSAKEYKGAYIVTVDDGKRVIDSGFSATLEAAQKLGAREVAYQLKNSCGEYIDGVFSKFADRGPQFEAVAPTSISQLARPVAALAGL